MSKEILYREDAQKQLRNGVNSLVDAVKVTLGAKGLYALLEVGVGFPHLTKDGVTVADFINLEDPVANLAASLVKDAANKAVKESGDGTTTTAVLTQAIYNAACEAIEQGANRVELKDQIESCSDYIVSMLEKMSVPIKTIEDIKNVARISSNGDEEITSFIADAAEKIDLSRGLIDIKESETGDTYLDVVEGFMFHDGFSAQHFVNTDDMTIEYEDSLVLLSSEKISNMNSLLPVIQYAAESGISLLIVAPSFDDVVLGSLIQNKLQRNLKVAVVSSSGTIKYKDTLYDDLSVFTKAKVFSESLGNSMDKFEPEDLGICTKLLISDESTTIWGDKSQWFEIEERQRLIKDLIKKEKKEYDRKELELRLMQRFSGIATIYIGAKTESELKERKDRLDDAVNAVRAAYSEGVVSGGGVALLNIFSVSEPTNRGERLLLKAITQPFITILENAGVDNKKVKPENLIQRIRDWAVADLGSEFDYIFNMCEMEDGVGYDVRHGDTVNMLDAGIIDATKSVRVALESAVSVSCSLILTGAVITEKRYD